MKHTLTYKLTLTDREIELIDALDDFMNASNADVTLSRYEELIEDTLCPNKDIIFMTNTMLQVFSVSSLVKNATDVTVDRLQAIELIRLTSITELDIDSNELFETYAFTQDELNALEDKLEKAFSIELAEDMLLDVSQVCEVNDDNCSEHNYIVCNDNAFNTYCSRHSYYAVTTFDVNK